MDGTEATSRWRGWRVLLPALLLLAAIVAALAVSCSGPGEGAAPDELPPEAAGGGPSAADVAALSAPAGAGRTDRATSTTVAEGTTSTTGGGGGPGGADGTGDGDAPGSGGAATTTSAPASSQDCAALEQAVIPAAVIITEADFVPTDQRPAPVDGADRRAAVARVLAVVPAGQRAGWEAVAAALDRAEAEGRALTPEEGAQLQAARNASEVWARAVCPGAPPSWQCDNFGSVGPGPDVAPTRAEAASPEAVLETYPAADEAVVLQRAEGIVLFGWVDDAGFVTRTHQVERIGGGWATSRRHVCHGDP